jgi:arylsulfatase A-like enzyme
MRPMRNRQDKPAASCVQPSNRPFSTLEWRGSLHSDGVHGAFCKPDSQEETAMSSSTSTRDRSLAAVKPAASRRVLLRAATLLLVLIVCPPRSAWCQSEAPKYPNVLFIAVDDLNDWVGFLKGHPQVQTPNMDRLARRGVAFASAYCAAPLCCPSRAAVFSGRQPFRTGIYHNGANIRQYHPKIVLLPRYFADHGYRTMGTGKLLHHRSPDLFEEYYTPEQRWSPLRGARDAEYTPEELGSKQTDPRHVVPGGVGGKPVMLPLNRMPSDRNPRGSAGESFDWGPFDVADDAMGDGLITGWAAERLQRERARDRPFLLCVGYYRPHIPLYAPRRYFELYPEATTAHPRVLESDLDDLGATGRRWAVEPVTAGAHKTVVAHGQWRAAVAAYLACVSFVDAQVGRLLDALDAGPHRDNTVIVLWGDHGWHLGEKEHWGKWTGWERATRVPLVIAPARSTTPGSRTGALCQRPVSLVDLFPTLVELCGLPALGDTGIDGRSLVPLFTDPGRETRPVVTTFDFQNYSVRTDRWRLIHYQDGSEELYDHASDPDEWRNLAGDSAHDATRAGLRASLPVSAAPRLGPAGGADGG